MVPALLDSSFLIELEREIESGVAGPALAWLRKNRTRVQRPLMVSCISAAEFLEGCGDPNEGMTFIGRFIPQSIGFPHATTCAELQRRARKAGKRFGENDAWQMAFADRPMRRSSGATARHSSTSDLDTNNLTCLERNPDRIAGA